MLPFFRKIRWRLAKDNQFLKYSRYAVGEIVLVVIGILIALQINNWNEDRKDRNTERELMEQLLKDIKSDQKMLKEAMYFSNVAVTSNTGIINAAQQDSELDSTLRVLFTGTTMPFVFFKSERATYDNLKSIGFQIISNKDLRRQIQDLYKNYDFVEGTLDLFNTEYLMTMDQQSLKKLNLIDHQMDSEKVLDNQPLDWDLLKTDMEFLNNLANMKGMHRMALNNFDRLDKLILELKAELEKEIERH